VRLIDVGEMAPTAGLAPRWQDLVAPHRGLSLEQAVCVQLGLPGIEIIGTGSAGLLIAFTYLERRSQLRRTVIVPGYTCPLVVIAAAGAGFQTIACDTVATSIRRQATIQALWRSRLGIAKLFSRAIGDYPDTVPLLQRSETPNAGALAAATITLSTSDALSPATETAILSALEEARQCR
jgi:hypothetical protein